MRGFTLRWLLRLIALTLLLAWIGSTLWHTYRRLPPGIHISGSWQPLPLNEVRFLRDVSAADASGAPVSERQIDAELQRMIMRAHEIVVIDAGLFGDLPAAGPMAARLRVAPTISLQITEALLKTRQEQPSLQVLLLVDPASVELSSGSAALDRLRAAGVDVVPGATGFGPGVGACVSGRPIARTQRSLRSVLAAVLWLVDSQHRLGRLAQSGRRGTTGGSAGTVGTNGSLSAQSSPIDRR